MQRDGRTSRRGFLRRSIAALATGGVASGTRAAQPEKAGKAFQWPVACRDALLQEGGYPDIWTAMRTADVDGLEVSVSPDGSLPKMFEPGTSYSIANTDGIKRLGEAARSHGRQINALCLFSRFDERPEEEVALTVRTAQAAARLGVGVGVVRIDLAPRKIKDDAAYVRFCIETGRKLVEATKDLPVRFGVENHGLTTNRPEFLRKVFGGIGSKRFGLTLDVGNFYWFGHPLSTLYKIYDEFTPWSCHVHAKSIRYPEPERERRRKPGWKYRECRCPIYEGDIDYVRVAAILRKHDYRGDLCIDDESLRKFPEAKRREVLKKDAGLLRGLSRGA